MDDLITYQDVVGLSPERASFLPLHHFNAEWSRREWGSFVYCRGGWLRSFTIPLIRNLQNSQLFYW